MTTLQSSTRWFLETRVRDGFHEYVDRFVLHTIHDTFDDNHVLAFNYGVGGDRLAEIDGTRTITHEEWQTLKKFVPSIDESDLAEGAEAMEEEGVDAKDEWEC